MPYDSFGNRKGKDDALPMTRKPDKGYPKPVDIYNKVTDHYKRLQTTNWRD